MGGGRGGTGVRGRYVREGVSEESKCVAAV